MLRRDRGGDRCGGGVFVVAKNDLILPLRQIVNCSGVVLVKHKDSFGKSENLSKIFFAEILVFDHDYEGKSSSSNGLL